MNARNLTYITLVTTAMLTMAGCTAEPAEPTTPEPVEPAQYRPPAQVRNATYAWSAENGIDLLDERGQLVRAAHESMIIAHYGGMDATYPGFAKVLDPEFASQINTRWDRSLAGTMRSHILQITETDIGFKATVCSQPSHFAIREADGTYRITNGSGSEEYIQFDHIVYTPDNPRLDPEDFWPTVHNTGPFPEPPGLPVSEHQWSAPTEDLFTDTGWTITFGADLGETMHRCEDWGRSIEPNVPAEGSETIRSPIPPKTLPAYPGW
ncbi:hypothetical protein EV641_118131 [Rhodococcus sp. SMB37]|uniref:hypothetical protein n=1 Tax=Rhodococcus sp. SMB37 TaxID=2512213 RepID=UPI0010EAA660|nr:hypothetical protein [Rhodococcus sp. SMB37]TCN48207.1 hypothetical protein EV641_118131 [Rhodococcus sp. SMB37]